MLRLAGFLGALLFFVCPALAADNPFKPYLTKKPPEIIRTLSEETRGGVKVQRVLFLSRTAQTPDGPVRSEISAIIARPVQPGRYPGILLLHGGGGYALEAWAIDWAARGFVVVEPDLPGVGDPEKLPYSSGAWKREKYGVNHFQVVPDVTASGIFDGVLVAVQSLYLLRSQPDVNPRRVGVTGVSWGGYTTIMVAGLAGKDVYAAYSIYGSGHFDLGSAFQKDLNKLPSGQPAVWLDQLDAKNYAPGIKAKFFEAAATNDTYFWIPAVSATFADVHAAKNLVFAPNADHWMDVPGGCEHTKEREQFGNGWMSMQVVYFDYLLKGQGKPFPQVQRASASLTPEGAQAARFRVKGAVGAAEAVVYYSPSSEAWKDRKWLQAKTERHGDWYDAQVPEKVDWFASVTDSRPVTVTSGIQAALGK